MDCRWIRVVAGVTLLGVSGCGLAAGATPTTPTTPATPASTSAAPVVPTTAGTGREIAWDEIDAVVNAAIAEHDLNGAGLVLIDGDDGVIDDRYWGDFSAERVSLVASSSKMITATVIMGLATDGVVNLDAPIADQVSWTGGNPGITLAQAMSSQSGLVGLLPEPGYGPYLCQLTDLGNLIDCARQIDTTPEDDRDTVPPGAEFRYGGGQWQLAGGAASDISGKPWAELVDEYLIQPCGVESLGYTNKWAEYNAGFSYPYDRIDGDPADLPATDNPSMEAGVYIDPLDYATLMLMHLNEGRCGDTQVVDPALIQRAHTNQIAGEYGSYGFGWAVGYNNTIVDGGAFGSVAWIDLDNRVGAWFVIEATNTIGTDTFDALRPHLQTALTS